MQLPRSDLAMSRIEPSPPSDGGAMRTCRDAAIAYAERLTDRATQQALAAAMPGRLRKPAEGSP